MKVLLVQPRGVQFGFTRSGTILPPLGLLYIASAVRAIADVRFVDADAFDLDDEDVVKQLGEWSPDLVGMTVSLLTLPAVRRFAAKVKQLTNAKIIVGGPLPTAAPAAAIRYGEFDMVGVGDGEPIMSDLCRILDSSGDPATVEGVLCRNNASAGATRSKPRRADLAVTTMPAWDLIQDFSSYNSPDCVQLPVTIVEAHRGCPYTCSFCSVAAISGRKRRARPLDQVILEIEYLTGIRGVRELSFVDPDFMSHSAYAKKLCAHISSLQRNITWFCNARAISVEPKLAERMRLAGCHLIYLGVESGDPAILRRINKRQTLDQVRKAGKILQSAGIKVSAGFIIGFPFDTDESVRRTIEFAKSLQPDKVQFSIFNWFPGIEMPVPEGSTPIGFHPKGQQNCWVEWQQRAYNELGQSPSETTSAE